MSVSPQLWLFKVRIKSCFKKKKKEEKSAEKISGWEREKVDLLTPCGVALCSGWGWGSTVHATLVLLDFFSPLDPAMVFMFCFGLESWHFNPDF